jgi:hypothetical protein
MSCKVCGGEVTYLVSATAYVKWCRDCGAMGCQIGGVVKVYKEPRLVREVVEENREAGSVTDSILEKSGS